MRKDNTITEEQLSELDNEKESLRSIIGKWFIVAGILSLLFTTCSKPSHAQDSTLCKERGHVFSKKDRAVFEISPKLPYTSESGDSTFIITPGKVKYVYYCLRCKRKFEVRYNDKKKLYSVKSKP